MATVKIHDLPEQSDFFDAARDEIAHLADDFINRTTALRAARLRNDAESAVHVASLHDRDKSRRLPGRQLLVANRRLGTSFLRDINDRKSQIIDRAMRRGRRSRPTILFLDQFIHVLGDAMKLLCANDKIDVRQTFQQFATARLGHAAEEPENHVRPFFGQPPEHAHLAKRFLVSHVAHAACV